MPPVVTAFPTSTARDTAAPLVAVLFSVPQSHTMSITTRRVSRAQCANCTCSPGLLSRTNKRSSWFAKQINLNRGGSGLALPGGSRKGSVFTIDAASLCVPEVKETNTSKRLEALRRLMAKHDLAVYIIPSEDEHHSEYVSAKDQRRSFVSGFQGSAGVAIVTRDLMCMNDVPEGLAALSTDSRYFNQATNELDFNWQLLKQGAKGEPSWEEWTVLQAVQASLDSGKTARIGVDPKLITTALQEKLTKTITTTLALLASHDKAKVELVPVTENLVDKLWKHFEDLPAKPASIIKELDLKYAGEEVSSKLEKVVEEIKAQLVAGIVVSALDEIAWLLNMRGSDIEFNPVFYAYLIVTSDRQMTLFADNFRFDTKVQASLKENHVNVEPYESFWSTLKQMGAKLNEEKEHLSITQNTSWEIVRTLDGASKQSARSIVEDLKAVKNKTELQGARAAHVKDGRALIRFFAWLESQLAAGELIDEIEADNMLTHFRSQEQDFVGLSFATISATGANGAVIHYKPEKGSCSTINPEKMYLNDSGSQFLDGTTDTTRTVHVGQPTVDQVRNYTLVLKGNIALGSLSFPEGTTGASIDAIARQHLWKHGLDYGHGTGHGVGAYLNVHEGPIGVGGRPNAATTALKPGHLLSNEPGYYEDGEYGIRIENVMFVKETGKSYNGRNYLQFETVTKVPFCKKLINVALLTADERQWVNSYHQQIWQELGGSLPKHSYEYNWLKRETRPL